MRRAERAAEAARKPVIAAALLAAAIMLVLSVSPPGASAAGLVWSKPVKVTGQVLTSLSCPSTTFCLAGSYDNVYTTTAPASPRPDWTAHLAASSAPSPQKVAITSVSCANRHLCVAVNEGGSDSELAISASPLASGRQAWTQIGAPGPGGPLELSDLLAVSCPSTALCVGANTGGSVESFNHPGHKAGPWPAAEVDSTDLQCDGPDGSSESCPPFLGTLDCPSLSLCVGVDFTGQVLTSTDPSNVDSGWTATAQLAHDTDAPTFAGNLFEIYSQISCPTARFCAVVFDPTGQVFTTTDPTGGTGVWHATSIGDRDVQAISCASTQLCVAVDSLGHAITSTNPTAADPKWLHRTIDRSRGGAENEFSPVQTSLTGVACPSTALCVAVDGYGDELIAKPAVR